jgi:chromosome segregation ATPase
MWFVSRRRHEDEVDKLRSRVLATEARHDKVARACNGLARQLAEADAANVRLHRQNRELRERLDAVAAADPERTAALARRVDRLRRIVSRLLVEHRAEKRRADRLQARLDDAVGLTDPRVEDGRNWQQTRQDSGRKTGAEA